MKWETHVEMVTNLRKPAEDIMKMLTTGKVDLWHAATGISGEAGELLDGVKKHVVYGQPLDIDNIIEELGDLEFYMEHIRQRCGISRMDTLRHNMVKLNKRYGDGYSDKAAQERVDKK